MQLVAPGLALIIQCLADIVPSTNIYILSVFAISIIFSFVSLFDYVLLTGKLRPAFKI